MKGVLTFLLATICHMVLAQKTLLVTDSSIAIPPVVFDANDALIITASATSSQRDFDYLVGKWKMHHRRLNKRLEGCREWTE
jgi:hypothetical protein